MGWVAVWQLALKQFGAETVEIRIVIILGVALAAVMVLIGMRHAFRPAGPEAVPDAALPPRIYAAPKPLTEPKLAPVLQPFRARKPAMRATRKSATHTINRQRASRPMIRRALTNSAEIDAPTVPPPPQR